MLGRRSLLAAIGVLALAAVPSSAAGARVVVDSGPLEARVTGDPWRFELIDSRRRTVLAEASRAGTDSPGTLGFKTLSGWEHATRVLSRARRDGRFEAILATTDPLRRMAVSLRRASGGVIALRARIVGSGVGVEAMGVGFEGSPGERYLGFGERSDEVSRPGGEVESYVADGPYQAAEYPFLNLFVPPWGLRDGREDATYFPIPWLLSSDGYGVLVDNPQTSVHRLEGEGRWSVEVVPAPAGEPGAGAAPPVTTLRLRFFAGPTPARALGRFSAAVGRQPRAAAPWVYGPWYQAGDAAAELEALRAADAPVSVLQTYTHYLPCGEQETAAERERVALARSAGVAITTYFNPMVCATYPDAYEPAAAAGALTENRAGQPYQYRYGANVDDLFLVGQYDFFEPEGRSAYAERLAEAMDDGYDGWMEDFGEYTPLDSVSADRIDGSRAHNQYARRYHCSAWAAVRDRRRPIVRFQRSGWTGAARCAQVVWGGDPTTSWGFDGLRSAVTQALSAGLSGIGIWGSDIGGFFALGSNELSPELLQRWVQLGALSPVMRTQRNGVAVPPRDRPQVGDPDQIENWRRYAKLHTQLYPYIRAAESAYRRRGLPLMRHLVLAHPGDARAVAADDEFLFGPDLLAAPVLEPGASERTLYLPRGRWIDLWRSASYIERTGAIRLSRAAVLAGRREVTVPAPIEELPIMVRSGAVLPLLDPAIDTLAGYGRADPETVHLAERADRLVLLAFPDGRWTGGFGRSGTLRSTERAGEWRLRVAGAGAKRIRLQAALSELGWRPCAVAIGGRPLARNRWSFDADSAVLRARFTARDTVLAVSSRGC